MDPITALLIMAVLAGAIAGSFVFLSAILGPKKRTPLKDEPFECGVESDGMPRTPMPVKPCGVTRLRPCLRPCQGR